MPIVSPVIVCFTCRRIWWKGRWRRLPAYIQEYLKARGDSDYILRECDCCRIAEEVAEENRQKNIDFMEYEALCN